MTGGAATPAARRRYEERKAAGAASAVAQVDARLMREPDVSETRITFVYGNDVWVVAE